MNISNQLKKFLKAHTFGNKIKNDYYQDNEERYQYDLKTFREAKDKAELLLGELGAITGKEIYEACQVAFMGRLQYNGAFSYTPGQFYDLEIPQAVRAVLEAIKAKRR